VPSRPDATPRHQGSPRLTVIDDKVDSCR
jgi:hypothetical protein